MKDLDPELKKQLTELLVNLLKNAQDAGAWAKAQIPILVQEKIAYGRALETAEELLTLAILAFAAWCLWRTWTAKTPDWDDGHNIARVSCGCILGAIGTFALFINTPAFLMVWFAPRLYIVEWLMDLVRTAKG